MSRIDFAKLKAEVSIAQVVNMLGLTLQQQGEQLRGQCPMSQSTQQRAFIVTPSKASFICFCPDCKKRERQGGDCIELVARVRGIKAVDAAQAISSHFGLNGQEAKPAEAPRSEEPERKDADFDPVAYMRKLDAAHVALKDCPIPEQAIRDFDGGYCSTGRNRGRLAIPVHDLAGTILAFMGLALKGEQPSVLFPKDFAPPLFFNLHRVGESGTLVLVQTPMDVLRAWDGNLQDVTCPLTPLTAESLDYLAGFMRGKNITELEFY